MYDIDGTPSCKNYFMRFLHQNVLNNEFLERSSAFVAVISAMLYMVGYYMVSYFWVSSGKAPKW